MTTKTTFLAIALLIGSFSFAQTNTFPTTGNVGVGTVNPTTNLHVEKWSPGVVDLLRLRNNYASSSALHGVSILLDGYYSQSKISSFENPQYTLGGNLQLQTYNNAGVLNTGILLDRKDNLGIGTTTPAAKLHINNGDNSYGAILASSTGNPFALYTKSLVVQPGDVESFRLGLKYDSDERNGFISFYRGQSTDGGFLGFSTNGAERMRLDRAGNVGIGTTASTAKLHVAVPPSGTAVDAMIVDVASFGTVANSIASTFFKVRDIGAGSTPFLIRGDGNVGIGTTTPDKKLTVNGTIHSSEVIVDTNFTPDYVFQKYYTGKSALKADYVMPTLDEIESFTKLNNHLPNVPSALEVQQKGLSLGEMSNVLLQKVEELTLYAIEQQKEIERLKTENKQYKTLAERLSAIEKELKK